jgi:RND family efflux transporter MFP subunit
MKHAGIYLLTGMFVAILMFGCKQEVPQEEVVRPVRSIEIGTAKDLTGRSFPGKARAFNEVNLGFEVSGTIADRPVSRGDSVKPGQLLARLDPRDFQNKLNAALAELERAKANRDRIAQAASVGAVAKQELTNAEARLKVAQADVEIRSKSLEDSKIVAPFAGYIAATYVENFQRVRAKAPVVRLLDQSRIKFDVGIPENLISKVDDVKEIFVKFDAFPDLELAAEIGEIGTEATQATRTYPITLYVDQPVDVAIMPGMAGKAYGKGQMARQETAGSFEVPVTAMLEQQGKSYVWVIDQKTMTVSRREVTTDRLTNFGIIVKGDLKAGDRVVTAGVHYLKNGQKVFLLKETSGNDKEVSS